jgi:NADPH:quinone reductase-like Zn-dependent oxidoreductase/NAD(P)-dependent dehydrogenase (short-subunit alcohol dehydrogenase family)
MVLEAVREFMHDSDGVKGFELENVQISRAMIIPETESGLETSLHVTPSKNDEEQYDFSLSSRSDEKPWQRNFTGSIKTCRDDHTRRTLAQNDTTGDSKSRLIPKKLYQKLSSQGMHWGASFQNLTTGWQTNCGCSFEVVVPDTRAIMPENFETPHLIHPATLDACFHAVVFCSLSEGAPKVPHTIDYVYVSNNLPCASGTVFHGRASIPTVGSRKAEADIHITSEGSGDVVIAIEGVATTAIGSIEEQDDEERYSICSKTVWKEDIDLLDPERLQLLKAMEIVELMSHKNPSMSVLEFGEGEYTESNILDILAPSNSTPAFDRYTYVRMHKSATEHSGINLLNRADLVERLELDDQKSLLSQGVRLNAYDCVIVPSNAIPSPTDNPDESEYISFLKPGGRLFAGSEMVQVDSPYRSTTAELIIVKEMTWSSFDMLMEQIYGSLSAEFNVTIKTAKEAALAGVTNKFILVAIDLRPSGVAAWPAELYSDLRSILLHSKRLLWLTRNATMTREEQLNPGAASILGLLRALRFEDSSLRPHTFDLPAADSERTGANVFNIFRTITLGVKYDQEYEFAECDGRVLIPRVLPDREMSRAMIGDAAPETDLRDFSSSGRCYRLSTNHPNDNETHGAVFEEINISGELADDEIEVQVEAQSLDKTQLVGTAAGTIIRAGAACQSLGPGDRVATVEERAVRNVLRCSSKSVSQVPDDISMSTATMVSSYHAIGYHILHGVAKLEAGETVLITDPISSLGQAVILQAQAVRAEVWAMAGDEETRKFLVDVLPIFPHHIVRLEEGLSRNQSRKWDVVLSTNPKDLPNYWRSMADFGRLMLLASGSTSRNERISLPRHDSATFTSVDVDLLRSKKPALISKAVSEVFNMISDKTLELPGNTGDIPFSKINTAVETECDGLIHRDVVLTRKSTDMIPVRRKDAHPLTLDRTATYIIVGGLGGLGRSIAAFLIEYGAQSITFFSRSGGSGDDSQAFLQDMRRANGVEANAIVCDVSYEIDVQKAIAGLERPIKGIIHAGMVLRDCMSENMEYEDFQAALQPKITGTWNLHNALLPHNLDFFVLLSSIAGVGGMRGQTNYAAGNSFQDAFAQYRRRLGLPATAIDLTVVLGVGVVAENPELIDGLKQAGVLSIQEEETHRLIKAAITGYSIGETATPVQTIVGVASGGYLDRHDIQDSMWPEDHRFRYMLKLGRSIDNDVTPGDTQFKLQPALPAARSLPDATQLVQEALVGKLAKAISVSPEDVDVGQCVSDYGVDSLIAVELRNWIQRQAHASVSVFDLMSTMPIRQLAEQIARESSLVKSGLKHELD